MDIRSPEIPFRAKRLAFALLISLLLAVVYVDSVHAEEIPKDMDDMSLEELLQLPLDPSFVNILESHIHKKGQWMVGFKYKMMDMNGNRMGTDRVSVNDVLQQFPVAPTSMTMEMYMGSLMYAPTDDLTLMAMVPFLNKEMDHVTRMGMAFTTRTHGIGDFKIKANQVLYRAPQDRHLFVFGFGVSFPTGSIDERDDTPAGKDQILPYPMQLGSGTYDLLPALTYIGLTENWSYGLEVNGVVRTGRNDRQYRLGDRLEASTWGTYKWFEWMSSSIRLKGNWWDNITGADPALNPAVVQTADPNLQGGSRLDLLFGLEMYAPKGVLQGNRIGVEAGFPVYQDLNGPQLETDWMISASWQWIF